jgi:hypothetical protein
VSQLTYTVLQLGFLALLWVLVLSVVGVLRRDLFGTKVVARHPGKPPKERRRGSRAPAARPAAAAAAPAVPQRTQPTKLVVTEGPLRGTSLDLGKAPVLVGRSPECSLVLTDDFASGRHARLSQTPNGWVVEDLGSTNGTQLNGTPLGGPTAVTAGAQLKIGRTVIELRR